MTWRTVELAAGWVLGFIILGGFIVGCVAEIATSKSPAERRTDCRDRGGVVVENEWGRFVECQIP